MGIFGKIIKLEPGISLLQWAYDRISNNYNLIISLIGGILFRYLGDASIFAESFGVFGIFAFSILFALFIYFFLSLSSYFRSLSVKSRLEIKLLEDWSRKSDEINPLEIEFHKKRIRISNLVSPLSNLIKRKKFIDCELIGECNILFVSVVGETTINGVTFTQCDIVALKDDARISNVIVMEDVKIIGGVIGRCTIFVYGDLINVFKEMGAKFITKM